MQIVLKRLNICQQLGDGICTVLHTNADGLLNKKHELLNFVVDKSPKIIAVTEITANNKLHANNVEYHVDGYALSMNNNSRRGISLHLHLSLKAQELPGFNKTDFKESLWASFDSQDKRKLLIGCVYRSPNSSDDNIQQLTLLRDKSIGGFDENVYWVILTTLKLIGMEPGQV